MYFCQLAVSGIFYKFCNIELWGFLPVLWTVITKWGLFYDYDDFDDYDDIDEYDEKDEYGDKDDHDDKDHDDDEPWRVRWQCWRSCR